MTQEVLIPKMRRKERRKFKVPFLSLALILLGVLLIVFSSFVGIEIKHYWPTVSMFSDENINFEDCIKTFYIIPQIPMVLFVGGALGRKIGTLSVLTYIIIGLFFIPIFALGGGLGYIGEYSFGYILAFVPAVAICASILEKRYSIFNTFLVSLFGVFTIHLLGFIYMSLIALLRQDGWNFILGWFVTQSGIKMIYDFVGSFALLIIGKYIHEWFRFIKN